MFFANDKDGNRISAEDAIVGESYYCPTCNTDLIFKRGDVRLPHFAHKTACSDHWHYEMSEWHQRMQGYFLPKYREVVIEYNGQKHRADILIPGRDFGNKGLVIEFQNSPINDKVFKERSLFYISAGYTIWWVFNINDNELLKKIDIEKDKQTIYGKIPYQCFKCLKPVPFMLDEVQPQMYIFLSLVTNHKEPSTKQEYFDDDVLIKVSNYKTSIDVWSKYHFDHLFSMKKMNKLFYTNEKDCTCLIYFLMAGKSCGFYF